MDSTWTPRDTPPAEAGRYTVTVELSSFQNRQIVRTRKVVSSLYGKPWGRFRGGSWWQVERANGGTRVVGWKVQEQTENVA